MKPKERTLVIITIAVFLFIIFTVLLTIWVHYKEPQYYCASYETICQKGQYETSYTYPIFYSRIVYHEVPCSQDYDRTEQKCILAKVEK